MAKSLTLPVHALDGQASDATVALAPAVFAVATNPILVSEVTVSAQANRRHAIANTLTRGEVRGGGKKPWQQKGTGRARAGSTRSPLWRHGGTVFGPAKERNFTRKINAKARAGATRMVLSALAEAGQIYLVDGLTGAKLTTTKQVAAFMNTNAATARHPMLLTQSADKALLRAARNLNGVMIRSMDRLGFLDLMLADQLILDRAALTALTARYASKSGEGRGEKGEIKTSESKNSALNSHSSTPNGKQKTARVAKKPVTEVAHA